MIIILIVNLTGTEQWNEHQYKIHNVNEPDLARTLIYIYNPW